MHPALSPHPHSSRFINTDLGDEMSRDETKWQWGEERLEMWRNERRREEARMVQEQLRWDAMSKNGAEWTSYGAEWARMGRNEQDGMRWAMMGRNEQGLGGMSKDGTKWERMGRSKQGWDGTWALSNDGTKWVRMERNEQGFGGTNKDETIEQSRDIQRISLVPQRYPKDSETQNSEKKNLETRSIKKNQGLQGLTYII